MEIILVSSSTYKRLEVTAFLITTKKELMKLQINEFSWTHQISEVAGQTVILKSGEKGISREVQLRSTYQKPKLPEP